MWRTDSFAAGTEVEIPGIRLLTVGYNCPSCTLLNSSCGITENVVYSFDFIKINEGNDNAI